MKVSVPSRGIGCINSAVITLTIPLVSVPSRGIGCIYTEQDESEDESVSVPSRGIGCIIAISIPSLSASVSVPSRGIGCIEQTVEYNYNDERFRPLTGHRMHFMSKSYVKTNTVSVPSRGIGCIVCQVWSVSKLCLFPSPHGA